MFVCLQGEHVVFLDVRKDRYFALEAQKTAGLGAIVPGWPVNFSGDSAGAASPLNADEVAQSPVVALLLENGLLSEDVRSGKDATPLAVEPASQELSAESYEGLSAAGVPAVLRFIASATIAALALRFFRMERVVRRVARRSELKRSNAVAFDAPRAHQLVAAFASLRPFFFTAKDACLFEALALSEFLARYGIYPNWVFGVRARPFAAHCWLQQGGVVFNDTVEHVTQYAPIMSV